MKRKYKLRISAVTNAANETKYYVQIKINVLFWSCWIPLDEDEIYEMVYNFSKRNILPISKYTTFFKMEDAENCIKEFKEQLIPFIKEREKLAEEKRLRKEIIKVKHFYY